MRCRLCQFENPTRSEFCARCGAPLAQVCPRCHSPAPAGFDFCGHCGAPLAAGLDALTSADLDHLRAYLPAPLVDELRLTLDSPPPRLLEQCLKQLEQLLGMTRAHLPSYLIERVMRAPTPGRIDGQFIEGTLLFADISGFTAMSERLNRIGREGADEIMSIVNRYFGHMLSILRDRDGQLIKFGGDALLGLFVEPDSATRAAQAAMAMQDTMGAFAQTRTSQGTFPLRMKVALHRGRFFAAQLGTAQSMEQAMFGADVNATAALEASASAGQVLLDRATLDAIETPALATRLSADSPHFVLTQIESSSPRFFAPPSPFPAPGNPTPDNLRFLSRQLDALTPYLSTGLLARLVAAPSSLSLEGEHRLVSILFANVHGLTELVERLGEGQEPEITSALNQYFVAMANAIHQFGGIVNKIDLSDYGDKLLALFGAPLAHADDAERAVRAALAMQKAVAKLPVADHQLDYSLHQRIAITYGYVFAGYIGAAWRHEYTVMGDEVNLAARLLPLTDMGKITITSNVERKSRVFFEITPRGQVVVEGKSVSVPILTVVGPRAVPEPIQGLQGIHSPLVGREDAWQKLSSAIARLRAAHGARGQIVSLMGDAGLGKTRLIAELRQHIQLEEQTVIPDTSIRWFEARCLSFTESDSYRPFRDLIQQLLGIHSLDTEDEALHKLRDTVRASCTPDEVSATATYLAYFLNLGIDESQQAHVQYLDAESLQQRVVLAISALIDAQARKTPIVLLLEDIHWLDQASLALLGRLLSLVQQAPLLWMLVFRPERDKGCWQLHERIDREFADCAADITLNPLSDSESETLLANLVPTADWSPALREKLLRYAEGNPFYLEEILRMLIGKRILARGDDGRWTVHVSPDELDMPASLESVMQEHLDRLPASCRWLAQAASVIGRVFEFDVLLPMIDQQPLEQVHACLEQLQRHEIVREVQRAPQLIYSFRHDLMRDVCYQTLLTHHRNRLHRQIAEHLEQSRTTPGERESEAALIAYHAFLGHDWARALRYHLLAGQRAKRLFANDKAIEHYQATLQCVEEMSPSETAEQMPQIHTALGELLTMTNRYEQALTHLNAAHELATQRNDADLQAHVCRWLGRLYELRGDYDRASEWLSRGLAVLNERETAEAAELWLIGGLIHSRRGQYAEALLRGQQALRLATGLGELAVQARAHLLIGNVERVRGEHFTALEHLQHARQLYQQVGELLGQARTDNLLGLVHTALGRWGEAELHFRQARERFIQLGDRYNVAFTNNNLGEVLRKRGDTENALIFYQEALAIQQQIGGSAYVLGVLHNNLGATYTRRGEVGDARAQLQQSEQYFQQARAREILPELRRHWAEVELQAGCMAEAEQQARQAVGLARELAMRTEEGHSLCVLGKVLMAQGRMDEAEEPLRQSVALLTAAHELYETARSSFALARWLLMQGRREEGQTMLAQCIRQFEQLGATLDLKEARTLNNAHS